MKKFTTVIKKPEEKGRLTLIEIPFDAGEVFNINKSPIRVLGQMNKVPFRNKLISRGKGKYVLPVDKQLQIKLGFTGEDLEVEVQLMLDEYSETEQRVYDEIHSPKCQVDVLTAIRTRKSIRSFTPQPIEKEKISVILEAGFCAPSAKGKRPWHFIVVSERELLERLYLDVNTKPFMTAACCIIVCGDKNVNGINDFLIEDCSAAAENILLAAHGLGLGAVWCGLLRNGTSPANTNYNNIIELYKLPDKIIPVAAIAIGYPTEPKKIDNTPKYEAAKVHYNEW